MKRLSLKIIVLTVLLFIGCKQNPKKEGSS